jgi:hypothetical protein
LTHVIAFAQSGFLEVQISVLPDVAVNGKCQLVCVERILKYGALAEMDMEHVYAIVVCV